MIPEIGHFALVLALTLALVQSVLPIWGAARNDLMWMKSATWSSLGQVFFTAIAFAALMTSFVQSDFTVVNVVENSHSLKPLLYKVSGTWGSHEGVSAVVGSHPDCVRGHGGRDRQQRGDAHKGADTLGTGMDQRWLLDVHVIHIEPIRQDLSCATGRAGS